MNLIGLVLIAVGVVGLFLFGTFLVLFKERLGLFSPAKLPYEKRDALLTASERQFYRALKIAAEAEDVEVFARVRLLDLIEVRKATEKRLSYQNKIQSKHADFVLCDQIHLSPLLVIELNDSSHRRDDRRERDAFVEEALEAADIPIIWVKEQKSYSADELARQIRERIGRPAGVSNVIPIKPNITIESNSSNPPPEKTPTCPKCGSVLVERRNRTTGEPFLACPGFPNCRYIRQVVTTGGISNH